MHGREHRRWQIKEKKVVAKTVQLLAVNDLRGYKEDTGRQRMPVNLAHSPYNCQVEHTLCPIICCLAPNGMTVGKNAAGRNRVRRYP